MKIILKEEEVWFSHIASRENAQAICELKLSI